MYDSYSFSDFCTPEEIEQLFIEYANATVDMNAIEDLNM